jgi:hypothetical protein
MAFHLGVFITLTIIFTSLIYIGLTTFKKIENNDEDKKSE